MRYIKEVFQEMRQVTWPAFYEVNHFTWIVIMMIVIFASYFALTDFAFSKLIEFIVKLV